MYIYVWALTFLLNDFFRIIQFQEKKWVRSIKLCIYSNQSVFTSFYSTIVIKRPQICYERIFTKFQQVSTFRFLKTSLIEDDDIPDSLHVSTIYTDHKRLFTPIIWYHAVYMYKAHIIHVNARWMPLNAIQGARKREYLHYSTSSFLIRQCLHLWESMMKGIVVISDSFALADVDRGLHQLISRLIGLTLVLILTRYSI